MTDPLNNAIRRQILEIKLAEWRQQEYSAEVNHRVAVKLEDEQLKTASVDLMKKATKAIDELTEILKELDEQME